MPAAAELTPHLAATLPRLAGLVPWLLIWGVAVVALALMASVLIVRNAARLGSVGEGVAGSPDAGLLRDSERRLRRGRRLVLAVIAGAVMLWGLAWLAGGPNPMVTELLFAVVVAGCLGPIYVALRIFEGAMARAAERVCLRREEPSSPSPRGGERAADGRD